MPVVEVCNVTELAEECQNGAPVIHLIRSPSVHPVKEAAHLQEEASQLPPGMTLEVAPDTALEKPSAPFQQSMHAFALLILQGLA